MEYNLTTKDLCDLYRISKTSVLFWRREGMPYKRIGPRIIRYNLEEVEEWLKKRMEN